MTVVDDGSRDGTAEVARAHAGRLPVGVIVHPRNQGLARAMETGLRAVLADADPDDMIVTMDADNTHPPDLIPVMIQHVHEGADLVIASRYVPGGREEGVPLIRRVLSDGIGILMRARFGLKGVRDYSSGYRAYRARGLQAALERYGEALIQSRGFTVTAELLLKVHPFAPRVVEVPLRLRYGAKLGESKMPVAASILGYLQLLLRGSRVDVRTG